MNQAMAKARLDQPTFIASALKATGSLFCFDEQWFGLNVQADGFVVQSPLNVQLTQGCQHSPEAGDLLAQDFRVNYVKEEYVHASTYVATNNVRPDACRPFRSWSSREPSCSALPCEANMPQDATGLRLSWQP